MTGTFAPDLPRTSPGDRKDKLEIGYALTYSATQLVSYFQLSDQQNVTMSTIHVSCKALG
jgi:hypothetical protein